MVQDAAACSLGHIIEHQFSTVFPILSAITHGLIMGLRACPKVATSCCWALNSIVKAYDRAEYKEAIASMLPSMFEALLAVDHRDDAWQFRLNIIAYETAGQIVHQYAGEKVQLLPIIIDLLESSIGKVMSDAVSRSSATVHW